MKKLFGNSKLAYQAYNFFKRKELAHNLPLYEKYGLKKKYFSSISSEDFDHLESPKNKYDELDSTKEMPRDPAFQSLEENLQSKLLSWSKDGYVFIDNFFSEEDIDAFNHEVEQLISQKKANWQDESRVMFAIHNSTLLRNAGNNEKLLKILEILMGKKVELFQSINFLKGSEQGTHSDAIHMTTFPYGNLIAVWVALEDINTESGPIHYYPESHKLPYIFNKDFGNSGAKYSLGTKSYDDYSNTIEKLIHENDLKKKVFLAKKGDILVWHANLLHGGEKQTDKSITRKSMVFHYLAENAICFHEITQRPTLKKPIL